MVAGAPVEPPAWTNYVFYDDNQIEARGKAQRTTPNHPVHPVEKPRFKFRAVQ